MIRVDMDMWPLGDRTRRYSLATVEIINDGTSTTRNRGNYFVRAYSKDGKLIRTAEIKDWPRLTRPVLELLAEALKVLKYNVRVKS